MGNPRITDPALRSMAAVALALLVAAGCTPSEAGPGQEDDVNAPFWQSSLMRDEPVMFIQADEGSRPAASLLFEPSEILAVTSATGEQAYEPGRDYELVPGSSRLVLPAGSRIPFRTHAEMYLPGGSGNAVAATADGKTSLFFSEGRVFHDLQVVVTYRHKQTWAGSTPAPAGRLLPRTMGKLRGGELLVLAVLGDSISAGGNASAFIGAAPHQPAYPELVARGLADRYSSEVSLKNLSVGGKATPWGIERAPAVAALRPDMVILALGMNDAWGLSAEQYAENTRRMMQAIREASPQTEILLVGSMLPNPQWRLDAKLFARYRDELAAMCGPGVAMADVTAMWDELLRHKSFFDLTGNGLNHPNDFGHRVYAETILAVLSE
jgi:lysophospholipase L1-like esterase